MKQWLRGALLHRHHEHASSAPSVGGVRVELWPQDRPTRPRAIFFDTPSGAGGDMIVAALCDLGVPWAVIESAVTALGLRGVKLELSATQRGAISALRFEVHVDAAQQTERNYAQIRQLLTDAALTEGTRTKSLAVFERLARAEAKVHRMALDDVHFHEVGAVDSLCDVVAACAAIDHLGAYVTCSPLPLGRGFVDCQHGRLPLPAPATVECLMGLHTYPVELEMELVTPTAAAVLGALSKACVTWPRGTLQASGWGAGTRVLLDRPNVVRAVLFEPEPESTIDGG